jgi:hypothetical protein
MPIAEATPELFADGKCGKSLPAGELLQVFKFGQFSPVKVLDGTSEAIVAVGKSTESSASSSGSIVSTSSPLITTDSENTSALVINSSSSTSNISALSMQGGRPEFTFKQLLEGETSIQLPARPTAVMLTDADVSDLVASGQMSYKNQTWNVALTSSTIDQILKGSSGIIEGQAGNVRKLFMVQPTKPMIKQTAKSPGVSNYEISEANLADFLADPVVPGEDDQPFRVKINQNNVLELAKKGQTIVRIGEKDFGIKVTKKPMDMGIIPFEKGQYGWRAPKLPNDGNVSGNGSPGNGAMPSSYQPRPPLKAADFEGITLAVYFEWLQEWVLKGFSRGRLLHSLSLAPQEETTIELSTWDRRKRTLEQSSLTETEQSVEEEEKTQDSAEIYREMTKKHEFELKLGGELDAQYNGGTVNVKLKAKADSADKTNVDDVTKNTTKAVRDGIKKAATKVKTQRSSKISETTEIGREEKITRKVRNPNMCHTLNLDYYEVITHYDVTTSFNKDGMRFCAMIRNPVAQEKFPREFIRQHEGALWDALLDRTLVSGFEALRLLRAREVAIAELDVKKSRRKQPSVQAAPGPEAQTANTSSPSAEESAANNYLRNLQVSCKKVLQEQLVEGLKNAFKSLADDQSSLGTKKGSPRQDDLDKGKRYLAQQLFLRHFSQLAQALGELASSGADLSIRTWGTKLAPLMPTTASMPRPSQLSQDPQEVKEGLLQEIVRPFVGSTMWVEHWPWWWGEIKRVGLMEPDDSSLGSIVEQFEKIYRAFLESESNKSAATTGQTITKQAQETQDQLSDEDRLEADFPLRDFAIATERAEVLVKHFEEHKHHYSFALFQSLPPQEQLEYIERAMTSIDSGFDPGFYRPRVVSQIGPFLLVPLNHEIIPDATELLKIMKDKITLQPETDTILLPSPGLTIDSRLGQCGTCEEFIEESRTIELRRLTALARQTELEADRMDARLTQNPQQLADPKPIVEPLRVRIEQLPQS